MVGWITEFSGVGLLHPTDAVVYALRTKHLDPSESVLACCDDLLFMEDSEIMPAHVYLVNFCLRVMLVLVAVNLHIGVILFFSMGHQVDDCTAFCRC